MTEKAPKPGWRDCYHFVVDLETLSTQPRSVVRSLALHLFDPFGIGLWAWDTPRLSTLGLGQVGATQTWIFDVADQARRGRAMDTSTVLWWIGQGSVARDAFLAEHAHVWSAGDALRTILEVLGGLARPVVLWAKPLHFDLPILSSLAEDYGLDAAPVFHRRRVHNARTVYEAASVVAGEDVDEEKERIGDAAHTPAADAELTAATITRSLEILCAASGTLRDPGQGPEDRPSVHAGRHGSLR